MKKSSLVLLGLIAGLALTSCNNDGYMECATVVIDSHIYESSYHYDLVAKYRSNLSFETSTQIKSEDGYYYSYFFVTYGEKMEQPKFPEKAVYKFTDGYSTLRFEDLEFVSLIGKYETYEKLFLSKDKKELKITTAEFNPVSAPNDKEVQGKIVSRVYLNQYGEIESTFEVHVAGTLSTSVVSTYLTIEGKVLQYAVVEK